MAFAAGAALDEITCAVNPSTLKTNAEQSRERLRVQELLRYAYDIFGYHRMLTRG
jgi:hypothetical protein